MLEEGVGDHCHERMAVKTLPGSAAIKDAPAYGWQGWLWWRPVDSFFPALLFLVAARGGQDRVLLSIAGCASSQIHGALIVAISVCKSVFASSGGSFVLDCANQRGEYGSARTTSDRLRDNAANTNVARLHCGHYRWQQ